MKAKITIIQTCFFQVLVSCFTACLIAQALANGHYAFLGCFERFFMKKVGVIGLGDMGSGLAKNLIQNGFHFFII